MIRYFLIIQVVLFSIKSYCRTFYISVSGKDTYSIIEAQRPQTPWKTVGRINSVKLIPGDTVLLKRGDTFQGELKISDASGIVIGAYGSGSNPVIAGVLKIENWKSSSRNNIYRAEIDTSFLPLTQLFFNGRYGEISRYPSSGYLYIDSIAGGCICDTKHHEIDKSKLAGSYLVVRTVRWAFEKRKIVSFTDGRIYPESPTTYKIRKGWGYFIENTLDGLKSDGAWYFDQSKRLLYAYINGRSQSTKIESSFYNYGIIIDGCRNIKLGSVDFSGQRRGGVFISSSKGITVSGCSISEAGFAGIEADIIDSSKITGNKIYDSKNNGILLRNCRYTNIGENTILRTGLYPGEGKSGPAGLVALDIEDRSSGYNIIYGNLIDSTGYIALIFNGAYNTVKRNIIKNSCILLDDGGGIYTDANVNNGNIIEQNILQNIKGNGAGTPDLNSTAAQGIYLDDYTGGVTVKNNVVINSDNGIYLHNGINNRFSGNTFINNRISGIRISADIAQDTGYTVRDNSVSSNTFVCLYPGQKCLYFSQLKNNFKKFAECDSNYYYNFIKSDSYISLDSKEINESMDLKTWEGKYGQDINSLSDYAYRSIYKITGIESGNLIKNRGIPGDVPVMYTWSANNNSYLSEYYTGSIRFIKASLKDFGIKTDYLVYSDSFPADSSSYYQIEFKAFGTKNFHLKIEPRIAHSPYSVLAPMGMINLTTVPADYRYIFRSVVSDSSSRIDFESTNEDSTYYLTGLTVKKVLVRKFDPSGLVKIFINDSGEKRNFEIKGSDYFDLKNRPLSGTIEVKPFNVSVAIKKLN